MKITKQHSIRLIRATCFGIILLLLFQLHPIFADTNGLPSRFSGKMRGFQVPQYYDIKPGDRAKIRSILMGEQAQPTADNKILISGLRIECYDRDGTTNTVVTTKDCIYDLTLKTVYSKDNLRLARTDDSMVIQGKGFSWNHEQSLLTISNQVRSHFRGLDVSGFVPATDTESTNQTHVQVTSDQFTFDQKKNNASYLGNVVVREENTQLLCDKLQLTSTSRTNIFEQIGGDGNVSIEVKKTDQEFTASGDQFIYVRTQNELAISGNVHWDANQQKGSADFVTLRQNGKDIAATGNVKMELQKTELKEEGLIGIPMATHDQKAEEVLTSVSDNLNSYTNRITLFGNVVVRDGDATLKCDTLNILFKAENTDESPQQKQVEQIEATGNIKISQKDHRIETQRATYKTEEAIAIFDEHVHWFSDRLQGESDHLIMWNEPKHAKATENIIVIMPIEGHIQPLELFGPEVTTQSPTPTTPKKQDIQVTSNEMEVSETEVTFQNKVIAEILPAKTEKTQMQMDRLILDFKEHALETGKSSHYLDSITASGSLLITQTTFEPETKTQSMRADQMKVQIDPKTGEVQNVEAGSNVIMEQQDIRATGKRAYFDIKTQQLELTGDPVAQMPKGTLYADKMIWDRKANVFRGVSKFRIDGQGTEIK